MTGRFWPKAGRTLQIVSLMFIVLTALDRDPGAAANTVEVPVLAAIRSNDRGAFNVILIEWDKKMSPDPVEVRWGNARIRIRETGMGSLQAAFRYAMERTTHIRPTGTLTLYGASYTPLSSDGPSAGAALAVGFLAVLRGEGLVRGVALTGTLQADGRIGPVGGLPDKIRAAAREGYRIVLIPSGQLDDPRWNLVGLGMELNIEVKEVSEIEEAYEVMTGRKF